MVGARGDMGQPLDGVFLELGEGGVPFTIYTIFVNVFWYSNKKQ